MQPVKAKMFKLLNNEKKHSREEGQRLVAKIDSHFWVIF